MILKVLFLVWVAGALLFSLKVMAGGQLADGTERIEEMGVSHKTASLFLASLFLGQVVLWPLAMYVFGRAGMELNPGFKRFKPINTAEPAVLDIDAEYDPGFTCSACKEKHTGNPDVISMAKDCSWAYFCPTCSARLITSELRSHLEPPRN